MPRAEQPLEEAIAEDEATPIEQATANAAVELQALGLEGRAKVTNVKVLTDEREVIRRNALFDKTQSEFLRKMYLNFNVELTLPVNFLKVPYES